LQRLQVAAHRDCEPRRNNAVGKTSFSKQFEKESGWNASRLLALSVRPITPLPPLDRLRGRG
jgi:hypothetical protein